MSLTIRKGETVRLAAGRHHITLKLLNGRSEETSLLIEKQVGLMTFDVLPGDSDFLGIVDPGMEKVEQDLADGEHGVHERD